MVKGPRVAQLMEVIFGMTFRAIQTKSRLMHIFMTSITGIGFHPDPILKNTQGRSVHLVAFPAIHLFVLTLQRELRAGVIKV